MRAKLRRFVRSLLLLSLAGLFTGCICPKQSESKARAARQQAVMGTRATYCRAPRKADGRVDVDKLISQLVEIHANTYSFCIHGYYTDWDDLKLILPAARAKGIKVWGSVVPPSESPPRLKMYAEPFKLDYERWAIEFAKLSLQEPNLVAWSIDDFTHNLGKPRASQTNNSKVDYATELTNRTVAYTPEYTKRMLEGAHKINPRLAFVPCCYYPTIKESFVTNYCNLIDGILFPYRHESDKANLKDPSLVEPEIKQIKNLVGPSFPVILDIYATAHSRLGATTPEYVREAMIAGHRAADGVMIYCHQDPEKSPEKYQIIKELFGEWATGAGAPRQTVPGK